VTSSRSCYVSTITTVSPHNRKCPTTIALVNSGYPKNVWAPANKNAITVAVKEELWRSS
jgi:hypothetical protein